MYFRCTACNSEITPMKKKPCTTFSGSMESVYTDRVNDFPKDEWEDLCAKCRRSILNYNARFYSPEHHPDHSNDYFVEFNPVNIDDSEIDGELSEVRLDYDFQRVNDVYEGYRDD